MREVIRDISGVRISSVTSRPLANTLWEQLELSRRISALLHSRSTAAVSPGSIPAWLTRKATARYMAPVSI